MSASPSGHKEEKVTWATLDGHPGVDLLWAEDCGRLWRWFHETYSICTLLSAPSDWTYRGKDLRTAKGEVMMMEPGEVHITRKLPAGVSTFQVALLSAELVQRAAAELGRSSRPHLVSGHVARPAVFRAFSRLHASAAPDVSPLERETRLAACLQHLVGSCAEGPLPRYGAREQTGVRWAREYLHEHCAETVRLEQLASAAGLSRFHFLRAFSQAVGLPPHRYLIRVRVERARALLGQGMSVAEVAAALGFADQSHLSRHFKDVCGVAPATYQAQRRRGLVRAAPGGAPPTTAG
jgi:AraC-like DNA-binding protein